MVNQEEILRLFSIKLRKKIMEARLDFDNVYEIRLRVNQPVIIVMKNKEVYLRADKGVSGNLSDIFILSSNEMKETMEYISNYSLYAFEDDIRHGFITVMGGHRVGICGKIFLDKGNIKAIRYISFINIRISHEIKGCSEKIIPHITKGNRFYHTLIISPPRCGKTTLLRDIVRQVSDGFGGFKGKNVGVIDERSELGGSYLGIPSNDLGLRTDILDCCPKPEGIEMLLRSMSPEIIAMDELGGERDYVAIKKALYCGCKILATVHGESYEDIENKPGLKEIIDDKIFERFIVLKSGKEAGIISEIYDSEKNSLWVNEI